MKAASMPPRPTALAQKFLEEVIRPGDVVIDATAGNGHDTLFLAGHVGEAGQVHAFDIQPEAIASARERISAAGFTGRVSFHLESHAALENHVPAESVSAVMFNLGYLPGQDHAVITHSGETLAALDAAARVMKPGGLLTVVCYPGHEGGEAEAAAVETHLAGFTAVGWRVAKYQALGTLRPAPFLLVAARLQ